VWSARVPKTKYNHLDRTSFGGGSNFAEIQVKRQEDSTLRYGLLEDLSVWESVKPLIPQVNGVMAAIAEPSHHANVDAHVRQKPHTLPLGNADFLLCQPSCVLQSLLDIFTLKIRIPRQNLFWGRPVGQLPNDD